MTNQFLKHLIDPRAAFVGYGKMAHRVHPTKWFLTRCGKVWSYRSKDKGLADECLKCFKETK